MDLLEQTQSLRPTCRRGEGFGSGLALDDDELTGQAVPFGKLAELQPGLYERFERGVFSRQFSDPGRVKLCLEHGQMVGKCTELWETDEGMRFRAMISKSPGNTAAQNARSWLEDDLVDELSVGFNGVRGGMDVARRDDGSTLVTHKRARLLEISLVPWGVYGRDATLKRSVLVDPEDLRRQSDLALKRSQARAWVEKFVTVGH